MTPERKEQITVALNKITALMYATAKELGVSYLNAYVSSNYVIANTDPHKEYVCVSEWHEPIIEAELEYEADEEGTVEKVQDADSN